MSSIQIHVFISHSWKYSGVYNTLTKWIFEKNWKVNQTPLNFRNFSIPKDDPIHNAPTKRALTDAILNQIKRSHVIVIPTGMYTSYSDWIKKEINGAIEHSKPILAVNPRGQNKTSGIVVNNSSLHIGWSEKSVINGIWKLYNQ